MNVTSHPRSSPTTRCVVEFQRRYRSPVTKLIEVRIDVLTCYVKSPISRTWTSLTKVVGYLDSWVWWGGVGDVYLLETRWKERGIDVSPSHSGWPCNVGGIQSPLECTDDKYETPFSRQRDILMVGCSVWWGRRCTLTWDTSDLKERGFHVVVVCHRGYYWKRERGGKVWQGVGVKGTYQTFFSTLTDLIPGFLGLIIKVFDNQTESWSWLSKDLIIKFFEIFDW